MQARRRERSGQRQVRRTVRIVCEGYAEEALLKHIRTLYIARSGNVELNIRNARGGGAGRVLGEAMRSRVQAGFDEIAILIDTDKDWNDALRAKARKKRIHVFESDPCLEAWLLRVLGHPAPASSAECKRVFAARCGFEAHIADVYAQSFTKNVLDGARVRVPVLDRLLRLIAPPTA